MSALGDIREGMEWGTEALGLWFRALANPIGTVNEVIRKEEAGDVADVVKLWTTSILVSLVIQLPSFQLFGISWTNLGFELTYIMTLALNLLGYGLAIHLALRLFRIPSRFRSTMALFSVMVSIVGPISAFLSLPSSITMLQIVRDAKTQNMDLMQGVATYTTRVNGSSVSSEFIQALSPIFIILGLCMFVAFTEVLAQRYVVSRRRSYLAVMASFFLLTPVLAVSGALSILLLYAFIPVK